jgi:hypothetical protein
MWAVEVPFDALFKQHMQSSTFAEWQCMRVTADQVVYSMLWCVTYYVTCMWFSSSIFRGSLQRIHLVYQCLQLCSLQSAGVNRANIRSWQTLPSLLTRKACGKRRGLGDVETHVPAWPSKCQMEANCCLIRRTNEWCMRMRCPGFVFFSCTHVSCILCCMCTLEMLSLWEWSTF